MAVFSLPKPEQASDAPHHHQMSPSITHDDLCYDQLDFEQLAEVMTLLISAIQGHISDGQSKQFAEQLLNITLSHLHKVVRGVVSKLQQVKLTNMSTVQFEDDTDHVLTKLTDYIMELRGHMINMPLTKQFRAQGHRKGTRIRGQGQRSVTQGGAQNPLFTEEQAKLIETWKTLDEKVCYNALQL